MIQIYKDGTQIKTLDGYDSLRIERLILAVADQVEATTIENHPIDTGFGHNLALQNGQTVNLTVFEKDGDSSCTMTDEQIMQMMIAHLS